MRKLDYTKLRDRTWDSEILDYVAQIHEYKGKQQVLLKQRPLELERRVKIVKIQSIEASNEIEGIRTTNTRLKQFYADKTTPRTRDEREIMGYRDVLNTIHENYEYIPPRPSYILQFHRDLYRYSEKGNGGSYKNTQNYISTMDTAGNTFMLFTPLPPYETHAAIDMICDSYEQVIGTRKIDPLVVLPVVIRDFLCVHPFNDGNGRMSHLLTMLLLYRTGYYVGKYISLESIIAKNKDLYYDALIASQTNWHEGGNDPAPFIKYLLSTILAAYRELDEQLELIGDKSPAIEVVRRVVESRLGKFTKTDSMGLCPMLGKTSVESSLKQYLKRCIMTISIFVRLKNV